MCTHTQPHMNAPARMLTRMNIHMHNHAHVHRLKSLHAQMHPHKEVHMLGKPSEREMRTQEERESSTLAREKSKWGVEVIRKTGSGKETKK